MTSHLSYADRESLLQALDRFSTDDTSGTERLLNEIADWARSLEPQFGFEHSLVRNITQLSCHLRDRADQHDIAVIARGALQFVLSNQQGPARFAESSEQEVLVPLSATQRTLLSDAFVASYAVHEISARLGTPITYNPPVISRDEQAKAEDMFLRLAGDSNICDDDLIAQAKNNLHELDNLAQCSFLRRLESNANLLIDALDDPQQSDEHKSYARGALRYLVENDDVIGDDLGLIGYLDDHFVIQLAVDFIHPDREPLVELLDEVVAVWPFINSLLIDDGSGSRQASEFAILNSALSCRSLRPEDSLTTILIAPETGPLPIVIGFIAALGLAQEAGQRELTEDSFRNGQKVIVDYSAVAEFAGFETVSDRKMFKLRQYYTDRGQRLQRVRTWPLADLRRLELHASKCVTSLGGMPHLFTSHSQMVYTLSPSARSSRATRRSRR